ncbi:UNVERIFIED_CONTAM: hypothetical protein K2H54_062092 [Gekko kuhli]
MASPSKLGSYSQIGFGGKPGFLAIARVQGTGSSLMQPTHPFPGRYPGYHSRLRKRQEGGKVTVCAV